MRYAPVGAALELTPGKADLIEWTEEKTLICRDGKSGDVRWDASSAVNSRAGVFDAIGWLSINTSRGEGGVRLVEPAPDLNGDGTGDLVWYSGHAAELLALSGKDGSTLWRYHGEHDGIGGSHVDGDGRDRASMSDNAGAPVIVDLDHDGAPDVVAAFIFYSPGSSKRSCILSGISGRSGRQLWTCPSDKALADVHFEARHRPAVLVRGRRSTLIAYVHGTQWLGLDPASGRVQAGPIELGFVPVRPVQHADLDGDGEPEVIALGPGTTGTQSTLCAFSINTRHELWARTVDGGYDQSERGVPLGDFPLAVDLDGDGRSEIVVSDAGAMPPLDGYRGVRLLDGLTGTTRWRRPLRPETAAKDGLANVLAAPDLDGDGARELFAVSLFDGRDPPPTPRGPDERRVYVDALSGRDGRLLWMWCHSLPVATFARIWTPKWWGHGPDGWPMLAVAVGGRAEERLGEIDGMSYGPTELSAEPEVHVLEASTGMERHRVPGLGRVTVADLDGDGLGDLWGDVEGELRAFRGEAPEAWRALGRFSPAGSSGWQWDDLRDQPVDLDGDGIGDTLGGSEMVDIVDPESKGSHVALARSGKDGHVIWKAVLDRWDHWSGSKCQDWYDVRALHPPAGDLDGDGTPDVIARKYVREGRSVGSSGPAKTLPLELFSGRTGAQLWSARPSPSGLEIQGNGAIWARACVVEPNSAPDLIVRHEASPRARGAGPIATRSPGWPSLARLSGRDGQVLWDVVLSEKLIDEKYGRSADTQLGDLDGDGGLDAVVPLRSDRDAEPGEYQLLATSLRDGKRLWSRALRFERYCHAECCVGDLDGDRRAEVAVVEVFGNGEKLTAEVRALDGRNGKTRWSWNPETLFRPEGAKSIALADFQGNGVGDVCVCFRARNRAVRIVVLDGNGNEHARRDVNGYEYPTLVADDLSGDGRDELIVWYDGELHALDRDLREVWSSATRSTSVEQILAPSDGKPGAVFIRPAIAIDGLMGRPKWKGQAGLGNDDFGPFVPEVLDAGGSSRMPLLIGNGLGATVCRMAMATDLEGTFTGRTGTLAQPASEVDDPRWRRPLPWLRWLKGAVGPWGFLGAFGLALINVGVPVLILRAVCGGRRIFRMWVLMMVPIVATVPLMVFVTFSQQMPVGTGALFASETRVFLTGTLAGVPIVWCVWSLGACLAGKRWRAVLAMVGLGVFVTVVIAGDGSVWIRSQWRRSSIMGGRGGSWW